MLFGNQCSSAKQINVHRVLNEIPRIHMTWETVYPWSQFFAVFFAGIALVSGLVVNKRQATVIEELKLKRIELEKSIAPRVLSMIIDDKGKSNTEGLKEFSGTQLIIRFIPEFEARRAAGNLDFVAQNVGWKVLEVRPDSSLDSERDGVLVQSYFSTAETPKGEADLRSERQARRASNALIDFLTSEPNNWDVRTRPSMPGELQPNTIKVSVALKPAKYFDSLAEPEWSKKLGKEAKERMEQARKEQQARDNQDEERDKSQQR